MKPLNYNWLLMKWTWLNFCLLQVKKLTSYLDPNAHGKINFKDFCHGVFAIKGKKMGCVLNIEFLTDNHPDPRKLMNET